MIHDYASRLGQVTIWYLEDLLKNARAFLAKYGDGGKNELNSLVSSHNIIFESQETTKFSYGNL